MNVLFYGSHLPSRGGVGPAFSLLHARGGFYLIYDNIRTICEEKKISIKQVERDLGFSNSSICKWNDCDPGARKLQKVADYLKVPIKELLK